MAMETPRNPDFRSDADGAGPDLDPASSSKVGAVAMRGVRGRHALKFVDCLGGVVLAFVWLKSGAAHLANPYYFLFSIYQYQLVSPSMGRSLAMVLPFLQIILALCLIGRVFVGGALLISGLMLGLFSTVQMWASVQDLGISCGCFGTASTPIGAASIATTLALFVLAATCLACHGAAEKGPAACPKASE